MKPILRHRDRDAIFREAAPGEDEGATIIPFPQQHHPEEEELPEHDWTQHGLGDPDEWEEENTFRNFDAALRRFDAALDAQGNHQFPGMNQLLPTGEDTGSSHDGTEKQVHPATGENWLIKTPPPKRAYQAAGDVAASAIQQYSGLPSPPTFLTENGGTPASAQLMFDAKDAYPGKKFDPEKVNDADLETIQKHHALDWLIGNHDAHGNQFIRDNNDGALVGIDKGQAFKHYNQDRLHWNYHPNGSYGETEPIYNTLYRNFAQGGRQINDPRTGEVGAFIQHLQDIPDNELADTLAHYANSAAERGALGKMHGGYEGHGPQRFEPNNPMAFAQAAIARKNNLMSDFGDLYDRAQAHRMTGTKIAWRRLSALSGEFIGGGGVAHIVEPIPSRPGFHGRICDDRLGRDPSTKMWAEPESVQDRPLSQIGCRACLKRVAPIPYRLAAPPSEHEMQDENEALGTNQRAHVFTDPQGQWIVKPPSPGNEYMVPLEVGTAALQKQVGLQTPETHAIPFQGGLAVASKRYPNVSQAFGGQGGREPISHDQLAPGDLDTIQKHQALDWLIGNHDAHVGNWLRNGDDGSLIGIDKGQAMKYFGQDRLDPTFHPNYYAREPIYNRLWRQHARGEGEMADPRQGELGKFVQGLQNIPDEHLRTLFAPYAHAAAQAGRLATGGPPKPERKLSPRSFPANDPEAFLGALVDRKNNLSNDLGGLYDRATKARSRSQRAQSQPGLDPDQFSVHEGYRIEALGLSDLVNAGQGLMGGGLPKLPSVPKPGTTPAPSPTSPATTPTAPGASPTAPTTAPGATPTTPSTTTTPASGGGGAGSWAALGIPIGVPSNYKGNWKPGTYGQPSEYGGKTTTLGPGDPGYGGGGAAGSPSGGGAPTSNTAPGTPATGGPGAQTNYAPSGGVEQWRPHVEEGLRRNGLPVTPDYVNKVLHQMQTESSGNPKAINNSDSNAVAGTPSKGLLQTIDPTFQSHHLPGDANDPYDPQANIDAAINYAKGRYGPTLMDSSGNGMGSGHGY